LHSQLPSKVSRNSLRSKPCIEAPTHHRFYLLHNV
jgi:hypothetical protein